MSRPKISFIVTDAISARYLLGGQLSFLADSGLDVHLITSPGRHLGALLEIGGFRCSEVSMEREIRPLADLVALLRIVRILRRERPRAVSVSTPKASLIGLIAAALARVPIRIYTVRGLRLETTRGPKKWILLLAEKVCVLCAHHIVLVSQSLRERYLASGFGARGSTRVLASGSSNGVDCSRFNPIRDPGLTDRLAKRAGLDLSEPVVGFVGRLVRDKGVEDLARAFRDEISPRFPTAQLLIVGGFESGDPISAPTRRFLEAAPRAALTGFVDEIAPWYHLMDVLVLPSYREGFPNAPLEAAASGIPAVAYMATGTIDAIENGRTGMLVPLGDVHALGEAIGRYLEDPELRESHGSAARARSVELFDQQKLWLAWRDFYSEVVTGSELEAAGK